MSARSARPVATALLSCYALALPSISFARADDAPLLGATFIEIATPPSPGPFAFDLLLDGEPTLIALEPHSVRAADFALLRRDGPDVHEVAPPPSRTYRGSVFGPSGRRTDLAVAASLHPDGLRALVLGPDGETRWIEPAPVVDSRDGLHVLYDRSLPASPPLCGVDQATLPTPGTESATAAAASGLKRFELAVEADLKYFQFAGSSMSNLLSDMETLLNLVTLIYEVQLDVTFELNAVIVQTSPPEIYTTNDDTQMMGQVMANWNANHQSIDRDLVHVMTGKTFPSGVAGRAWLGGMCSSTLAYGWSATTSLFFLDIRVSVVAHELGHNFGANHCNGAPDCGVMCAGVLGCGGDFLAFGQGELQEIQAHIGNIGCFDIVPAPIVPPLLDTFPKKKPDPDLWSKVTVKATKKAHGEPSHPRALRLTSKAGDDGTKLLSRVYDLSETPGQWISLASQHRGTEPADALVLESRTTTSTWVEVGRVTSDGADQHTFRHHAFPVPSSAHHDATRFRLRLESPDKDDLWFFDDFQVTGKAATVPLQALLEDRGDVTAATFGAGDPTSASLTIGIGNRGDPTKTLSWTATISSGADWLSLTTAAGVLSPGSPQGAVGVDIDASGLATGTHAGVLSVRNNGVLGDGLEIPIVAVVTDVALFDPGDTLTGTLSGVGGQRLEAAFRGVAGTTVTLGLDKPKALKTPTVAVIAPDGSTIKSLPFSAFKKKGKKKSKKKPIELTDTGVHRIVITGADGAEGDFAVLTSAKLPTKATLRELTISPKTQMGPAEVTVRVLAGARLSATFAATVENLTTYSIRAIDPDGHELTIDAYTRTLSEGGAVALNLPIATSGDHRLVVDGFISIEPVAATIDPSPTLAGGGAVAMTASGDTP